MTLPISFVMRAGQPADTSKVQKVLDERDFRSIESREILQLVEKFKGLDQTRAIAVEYAKQAMVVLEEFPSSVYRDAIRSIPEFILNRNV